MIESHRVERGIRPFRKDDGGVDRVAKLGFCRMARIDVDVQLRVELAQLAKAREQAILQAALDRKGAFALDGKMIDMPLLKNAQKVLDRAKAAGKI